MYSPVVVDRYGDSPMESFEIGLKAAGGTAVAAVATMLYRVFRQRTRADPAPASAPDETAIRVANGFQMVETGMLEIKVAISDLPAVRTTVARHDSDIRRLTVEQGGVRADILDVHREISEADARLRDHENRLKRLERGDQGKH